MINRFKLYWKRLWCIHVWKCEGRLEEKYEFYCLKCEAFKVEFLDFPILEFEEIEELGDL